MKTHLRTTAFASGVAFVALLAVACAHKQAQQAPEPVHVSGQVEPEPVVSAQPEEKTVTPAPPKTPAKRVASLGASSSGRSR